MERIRTRRLDLIPLTGKQLACYLDQPRLLEMELGFPVSRSIITDRVRRAVRMKLAKMETAGAETAPWITYWMLVIRDVPFGAGMAGFKGFPDENGEAEIGYGIDPAHQRQGYMTEAVKAMLAWAFEEPLCRSVTARGVEVSNTASRRVLEKAGMIIDKRSEKSLSYRIRRKRSVEADCGAEQAGGGG